MSEITANHEGNLYLILWGWLNAVSEELACLEGKFMEVYEVNDDNKDDLVISFSNFIYN